MFKKGLISVLAAVLLLLSNALPAFSEQFYARTVFIDMTEQYWASDAVNNMAGMGIINGYPDGTFKPAAPVTRAEFAALICKTFNLDLEPPAQPTFYDVQPDSWSYKYVEAAKDYLTGYYPPNGHPFFAPSLDATREDVAVALVKTLGYTRQDLQNPYILGNTFYDVDSISYQLRDYVALAVEKNLFKGYPDGTFRADTPVTRAEAATLLYKVIKSSAGETGPVLNVSVPQTTAEPTVYISGTTDRDAKVTINNEPVDVVEGQFKEGYNLEEEGDYEFVIAATLPGGKSSSVTKQVTYAVGAPEIKINNLPATTGSEDVNISGTVTDGGNQKPKLYLNDQEIYVNWDGSFETNVSLSEGENQLIFEAISDSGKSSVVTRTITFAVDGPILRVDYMPESTSSKSVAVSGIVTDKNDNRPKIYINHKEVYVNNNGSFETSINLSEGVNTIEFRAVNKLGKTSLVKKQVTFNLGAPVITFNFFPTSTGSQNVTLSGTVTDNNDSRPKVYLDDKELYVDPNGVFETTVTLEEGMNILTFRALNNLGKSETVTKTITLTIDNPILKIDYLPATASSPSVTVSGTISDKNDDRPKVYINDQEVYVTNNGTFEKTVNLAEGENTITFLGQNKYGKTTTETKIITYTP